MSSEPLLITPPTDEPVTLAELKDHLSIESNDFDDMIADKGAEARDEVEVMIGRRLISQTWEFYFDRFESELIIPWGPAQSIESIKYVAATATGTEKTTLASSVYEYTKGAPVKIRALEGQSFPTTKRVYDAVVVRVILGYGDSADDVPRRIKSAIKMRTADDFRDREGSIIGLQYSPRKGNFNDCIRPYRTRCN